MKLRRHSYKRRTWKRETRAPASPSKGPASHGRIRSPATGFRSDLEYRKSIISWTLLLLVSLVGMATPLRPQTRTFPDTREGIMVFSDQIPPGNTSAQDEFAATHYVGTQKMTPQDIESIRAYNPDFIHLHYQLAVYAADSSVRFIDGNNWVTDWGYVDQQDNWFVTDSVGTRIMHDNGVFYLMDVSGQISGAGENGWKEYWADTCIDRMRNNEADGVFADVYDVSTVNAAFLDPPYWWFEGTNPLAYWVPHLDTFGNYITDRLHAEPENFYVLPNLGFQVTSWDTADYSIFDGGMIEGFGKWGPQNPFVISDWKLQMNRILDLVALDRIMILQSYMYDALDYGERSFYLGCYLLVKGHHTYINILSGGPGDNMQYYPEYDIDLGPYAGEPSSDIDDLYDAGAGVYRREYEKGLVMVNPFSLAVSVDLDSSLYLVVPAGGGGVDGAGDYGGSLGYEQTSQVLLGAYEGAVLLYDVSPPSGAQVTDLNATHRNGQTFITWTEISDNNETYRVYRYDQPITSVNLGDAEMMAEIPEGSAFYESEWARGTDGDPGNNALQKNFIIEDLGPELPDGTGLLVWTPHEAGAFYYAATAVVNGVENREISPSNSRQTAVIETDDPPEPVMVWASPTGHGWVFTQFMDYGAWNPTYDGYAYNYGVGVPDNYDGVTAFPLTIHLDGWGSRYDNMDGSPYNYQTIYVGVDDYTKTWYYGNAATYDYDQGNIPTTGSIANFTEWRILRSIDDIIRDSRFIVDENRIYAFGGSMGGSGAVALGMRYPDVFAAVFGAGGMTNYATAGDSGGTPWENDLAPKIGTPEDNLPVVNLGPRSAHLARYDGMGVWDWMNHQQNMLDRVGDEMSFIATTHGDADHIVDWRTQGAPWYPIMEQQARRGFAGNVIPGADHYWFGFGGCGPMFPFESYIFRKDRSFPGLSDFSLNSEYEYNQEIEWSCPWHDFAGDIVDTHDRYEIVLRIVDDPGNPDTGTVDISPRRLQAFQIYPEMSYLWRNESLAGGGVIQNGTIYPDQYGLLFIDDFTVSKGGNRLVIEPEFTSSGDDGGPEWKPASFALKQPTPNPFRSSTSLSFDAPAEAEVTVKVYDIRGRFVKNISTGKVDAGRYEVQWDGRDDGGNEAPSGIYLIHMAGGDYQSLRKVVKIH